MRLYRGEVSGEASPGAEDEPVAWLDPRSLDLHPIMQRQLLDAGLLAVAEDEVDAGLWRAGLAVVVLPPGGGD